MTPLAVPQWSIGVDDRGVLTFLFQRDEVRNALSVSMIDALTEVVAAPSASVRVVIIGGVGRAFCSGIDLRELATPDDVARCTTALNRLVQAISTTPAVVVCRVNGDAYGAGLALIGAADITVASRHARFGFPEVRHGMVATVAASACAPRLGPTAALELLLTGRRFSAVEGAAMGLISSVVGPDDLQERLAEVVGDVLSGDQQAVVLTKSYTRSLFAPPFQIG